MGARLARRGSHGVDGGDGVGVCGSACTIGVRVDRGPERGGRGGLDVDRTRELRLVVGLRVVGAAGDVAVGDAGGVWSAALAVVKDKGTAGGIGSFSFPSRCLFH